MLKKVILVFKTHFDIGFTDLAANVIDRYANTMLEEVIATCKATRHMGRQKYIWTMPAWPLKIITERCGSEQKKELDELIDQGQIVWHALPFTSHTDFCSEEEYIEGLRFARELSETYHKPYPVSAKMTDVPGHGLMLPEILSSAGVKFLHLGCNPFANPPKVPFLFFWQALSEVRLLTMYSKGGYGTSLLPPEDWNYPVWMALMQTGDNCGPQSAAMINKMVETIHDKYPSAEVVCGTMDEFYHDLSQCDLSSIPIVTKDLADTWIHGVGAYPGEIGILREERERSRRLQALIAKQLLEGAGQTAEKSMPILDRYYESMDLFEEHTWGADVKTWLGSDRVYDKREFLETKPLENYRFMEASWNEQRDRAKHCVQALDELKALTEGIGNKQMALFNPNGSAFSGWVSLKGLDINYAKQSLAINGELLPITKIEGEWACYAKGLEPFKSTPLGVVDKPSVKAALSISKDGDSVIVENHRYRLKFSETSGRITELFDKTLNSILLQERGGKPVFSYQYDRYGIEDITEFLRGYAYRFSKWGIEDYGRENYPECGHRTYYPRFTSYSVDDDTVIFYYEGCESPDKYGDARQIKLEVTLPPVGDELYVTLHLLNKQETPYIESGSFLIPLAGDQLCYRINKSNAVLDPASDIQDDANHVFYCLENYMSVQGEKNGLCVIPKDTPLAAIDGPGVYAYRKKYEVPKNEVIYFNLFNNMWGTNFPQWIGGDFRYRFILFGFNEAQNSSVTERAALLKEGAEVTRKILAKEFGEFPEHMQLINARKGPDGLILRFRDLSGEEASRRIRIANHSIMPVDLHNKPMGEASEEEVVFDAKPFGIYSFLVS